MECKECNGTGKANSLKVLREKVDEKIKDDLWIDKVYESDINDIMDWLFKEFNKVISLSKTTPKKKKG